MRSQAGLLVIMECYLSTIALDLIQSPIQSRWCVVYIIYYGQYTLANYLKTLPVSRCAALARHLRGKVRKCAEIYGRGAEVKCAEKAVRRTATKHCLAACNGSSDIIPKVNDER
jgi:hypothetical protein